MSFGHGRCRTSGAEPRSIVAATQEEHDESHVPHAAHVPFVTDVSDRLVPGDALDDVITDHAPANRPPPVTAL
jgi:hypothetical protein